MSLRRSKVSDSVDGAILVSRGRLAFGVLLYIIIFALFCVRMVECAVFPKVKAKKNYASQTRINERPEILDRNGVVIATTLSTLSVYVKPDKLFDQKAAIAQLSDILAMDEKVIAQKLKSKAKFVWVKRDVSPQEAKQINAIGDPAIGFIKDSMRAYPYGNLFSHVVGYVDVDNKGIAGIEKSIDSGIIPTDDGRVNLSLDMRVQGVMHDELERTIANFSAIGGAGMVVEVDTGEIISMVSMPDFDPHKPSKTAKIDLFNRVTSGVYEMGSTFKALTTAMALDSGRVSMEDGFDATNPIRMAGFTINDSHPKARWLSVPEIFMYSSNIGTAKMAMEVGGTAQKEFLDKLGLFKPVDIGLPERGFPIVPRQWGDLTTMTVSFGHGIAVSPVHMVRAMNTLINGGYNVPLTLLKNKNSKEDSEQIISSKTSENMRNLLRLVVEKGTGGKAEVAGYYVGGKTGTAEKSSANGYNHTALISSFLCAFPMNDPKYVVLIVLDEPKGTKETFGYATAGWTAAPAASRVIERIGPVLGVRPVMSADQQIQFKNYQETEVNDEAVTAGGVRLASY